MVIKKKEKLTRPNEVNQTAYERVGVCKVFADLPFES